MQFLLLISLVWGSDTASAHFGVSGDPVWHLYQTKARVLKQRAYRNRDGYEEECKHLPAGRKPFLITTSEFNSKGNLILTASWDRPVQTWNPADGFLLNTYTSQKFPVRNEWDAHFDPTGEYFISTPAVAASRGEKQPSWVAAFNVHSQEPVMAHAIPPPTGFSYVAITQAYFLGTSGNYGFNSEALPRWQTRAISNGEMIKEIVPSDQCDIDPEVGQFMVSPIVHPSGKYILYACVSSPLELYDSMTGKLMAQVPVDSTQHVLHAQFSKHGNYIFVSSMTKVKPYDYFLHVYDRSLKRIKTMSSKDYQFDWIEGSPANENIVLASSWKGVSPEKGWGFVQIIDWSSSRMVQTLNFDGEVPYLNITAAPSFSPDGSKVVVGDYCGLAHVWDVPTRKITSLLHQ